MLNINDLTTILIGPISLSVAEGECVAILGPSGSGKSLLLRAIADLDPNEGTIMLAGATREGMAADEWRRRTALVPAESGWWADRVGEHFKSDPPPESLAKAVGLPDALDWEVSRLSSGERHRLAIARALQGAPKALLLDEPTAALDPDATQMVENLIAEQNASGVPILLVTHDAEQADRLASRSFSMNNGQLSPREPGA